jgi:hypothetical protein
MPKNRRGDSVSDDQQAVAACQGLGAFGERRLRSVPAGCARHYNGLRPHRSRELRPPRPDHYIADISRQRIKRRRVLGCVTNEYERAAQKPRSRSVAELWNPTSLLRHPTAQP